MCGGFLTQCKTSLFSSIHNFTILCHKRKVQMFTLGLGKSHFFFSSFKLALTLSPEVNLIAVGDNLHIWFPLAHPNSFLYSYLIYVST